MRPRVGELCTEPVPLADLRDRLQRVVIRVSVAIDLVDDAKVRELCEKRPRGLNQRAS